MQKINHKAQKNINHATTLPILLACLGSALLINSASAQTFYKWVDKAGSTHYTQTPPPGNLAKKAKTVQVDETPVSQYSTNNSNANGNTTESSNSNNATGLNSNQLAQTANAGSIPDLPQNLSRPTINNNANNSTSNSQPTPRSAPSPAFQSITPPPDNRLITPSQDQVRPAFSER